MASGVAVANVTAADAVDSGLATLATVMLADEAVFEATNRPSLLIVPPFADQTTPELLVFATAAVNWTVPPAVM